MAPSSFIITGFDFTDTQMGGTKFNAPLRSIELPQHHWASLPKSDCGIEPNGAYPCIPFKHIGYTQMGFTPSIQKWIDPVRPKNGQSKLSGHRSFELLLISDVRNSYTRTSAGFYSEMSISRFTIYLSDKKCRIEGYAETEYPFRSRMSLSLA